MSTNPEIVTIQIDVPGCTVSVVASFGGEVGEAVLRGVQYPSAELFRAEVGPARMSEVELEAFEALLGKLGDHALCMLVLSLDSEETLEGTQHLIRADLVHAATWHFVRRPSEAPEPSRAARALSALTGLDESGDGPYTALVDLLANAMHLYGVVGVNSAMATARDHFSEESK